MGKTASEKIGILKITEERCRKVRSDVGSAHYRPKYGGMGVRQYDLAGNYECEYGDLQDAVERNGVRGTYQGILACCEGRIRKHHGKVFRWASSVDLSNDI